MPGAILGDMLGAPYEFDREKRRKTSHCEELEEEQGQDVARMEMLPGQLYNFHPGRE